MEYPEKQLTLPPPWDRIFPLVTRLTVWIILIGIIYLLRSFFLLVLLTFIFAYIQASGVKRLEKYIKSRPVRVIIVGSTLLGTLVAVGIFVFPQVQRQAENFASQFPTYIGKVDYELKELADKYPALYRVMPELREFGMEEELPEEKTVPGEMPRLGVARSPTASLLKDLAGMGEIEDGTQNLNHVLDLLGGIGGRFAAIASAFLLSLLFSFLIVLDMPRLRTSVINLRNTKIRFIYEEAADNIYDFSVVLGQALEAQFFIAFVNTLLTAAGLTLLGLGKNIAFLSVIVFFSSFIPVVGVFISSIPICLIALQMPDGVQRMILAILLITAIHIIEGYILNPNIYGSRMRINPVIVLMILTISGKLFHFWGLILGVPIATYLFGHAIRYRSDSKVHEVNKAEESTDQTTEGRPG